MQHGPALGELLLNSVSPLELGRNRAPCQHKPHSDTWARIWLPGSREKDLEMSVNYQCPTVRSTVCVYTRYLFITWARAYKRQRILAKSRYFCTLSSEAVELRDPHKVAPQPASMNKHSQDNRNYRRGPIRGSHSTVTSQVTCGRYVNSLHRNSNI